MVMFWVWPFFFSPPGNKQTRPGTVEDNSDFTITGMTRVLSWSSVELVVEKSTCLRLQCACKKFLVVWKVDDKLAGIRHSRL